MSGRVIATFTLPRYWRERRFAAVETGTGTARIVPEDGGAGVSIPRESVDHFIADLRGELTPKVRAAGLPRHPAVAAVVQGKAEFLGKGNDGLAFRVGDLIVKMSTTVPYQPFNSGHRTPAEAARHLRNEAKLFQRLNRDRVACVPWADFVIVGDKAFEIRPYYDIPKTFTVGQLALISLFMSELHDRGLVYRDKLQFGIDEHGDPWVFDLGSVAQGKHSKNLIYDDFEVDIDALRHLFLENRQPFLPHGSILDVIWNRYVVNIKSIVQIPGTFENWVEWVRALTPIAAKRYLHAASVAENAIARVRTTSKNPAALDDDE